MFPFAKLPVQAALIFLLLFTGSTCTSSLIPVMGYFIVDGLGEPAWKIRFYSGLVAPLTLLVNKRFGEWLDGAVPVRRLLMVSILAYLALAALLASGPAFWILVAIGAPLMSLANGATATTFTFGRLYADRHDLDTGRYNALLRMGVSLAWMIGPALSFLLISLIGFERSFAISASAGLGWLALWQFFVPKDFRAEKSSKAAANGNRIDWSLLAAAISCMFFALGNVLFTIGLPMYLIQEIGLPEFAPGLSLSIKCFVEIFAIFGASRLAERIGARKVMSLAAILAVVAFGLFSQAASIGEVGVYAALEGLYYGLFAGVGVTFIQSFAPDKPGRATAVYMNSPFLGGMIGSVSTGIIASAFTFRTVVFFAAGAGLCALIFLQLTRSAARRAFA